MKITLTLALTLAACSAFAQQPAAPTPAAQIVDARFAAWIGCWRLEDDLAGTGARMCITPEQSGVRMQTVVGTQRGIDEVVIADAVARPIADSECKGTELAEWSSDGARVFRTTNVTCGKEAARTIKSVAFLTPGPSWVNVQHVSGSAVNTAVRVQRYRRAANQTLADGSKAPQPDAGLTLRTTADTTRWSIEDVIEASSKMPAETVQAALTEANHGFDLNKRTLLALDEGGVNDQVIDLMVALTYPKRFVVERRGGGSTTAGILTGNGWFDPMMMPGMMTMGAYADCFSPFGYGYRSYYSACNMAGYSPFGYDYYGYNRYGTNGYYGNGYYRPGGWVNVGAVPQPSGSSGELEGNGRAVNGRGYTQVRSRDSEGAPRVNSGSNGSGSGRSGNDGNASSGGYSSGSSSSGSSGGSSSGGGSGARVAVPKGPGV